MKAKKVFEFQQGQDPYKAMDIGNERSEMKKLFKDIETLAYEFVMDRLDSKLIRSDELSYERKQFNTLGPAFDNLIESIPDYASYSDNVKELLDKWIISGIDSAFEDTEGQLEYDRYHDSGFYSEE
jgi:hypothetical protein